MGILELIKQRTLEEVERIGREEGLEKGREKGLEEGLEKGLEKLKAERKKAITNMLAKDFSVEMIAGILEIPTVDVQIVEQEILIKFLFQKDWTTEAIEKEFHKNKQDILLTPTQLKTIQQTVQVEQLLSAGFTVETIMKKLNLTEDFILNIKK